MLQIELLTVDIMLLKLYIMMKAFGCEFFLRSCVCIYICVHINA